MPVGNVNAYDGQGKRTFATPKKTAPVSNTMNQQGSAPSDARNIRTKNEVPARKTDSFSSGG